MSCGFICGHDFVHCAHAECFRIDVKTMNKEKKSESVDGELFFCEYHNPNMSKLYNSHKSLVDWHPNRLCSHMDINIDYKLYAIPRAIETRVKFQKLLHEQKNPPVGHSYYVSQLMEQYTTCKYLITGSENGELKMMCLNKLFVSGYIPKKLLTPVCNVY